MYIGGLKKQNILFIILFSFLCVQTVSAAWFDWNSYNPTPAAKKLSCIDLIGSLPKPVIRKLSQSDVNQIRMFLSNPNKNSHGNLGQVQTDNKEFKDLISRNPGVKFLRLKGQITNPSANQKEAMDIYLVDGAIILVRQKQLLGQMLWTTTQSLNANLTEIPADTLTRFNYEAQQTFNELIEFDSEIRDLGVRSVSNGTVDYYYIGIAYSNVTTFRYFILKFLDRLLEI